MNKWAHIFIRLAHLNPGFGEFHNMQRTRRGLVFRTSVPTGSGYLFRCMFAIFPDGRIFGPRNRQVDEVILVAWLNDPKGLNDFC